LVLAIVLGVYTVVRLGRREGLDVSRLLDFSTWVLVVSLLGAKLLMVLTDFEYYRRYPSELLSWETLRAGGVYYGGFVTGCLFALWYVRHHNLPLGKVFDVYAPALALGHTVGRLGCFSAGCDYGKPTSSFLGVVFTDPFANEVTGVPLGVALHPTQLYESAASLLILVVLLWHYPRRARDGEVFLLFMGLYAVARFFIEYLRGDQDRGFVFGGLLSTSQFIAVWAGLSAVGIWLWLRLRRGGTAQGASAAVAPRRGSKGRR